MKDSTTLMRRRNTSSVTPEPLRFPLPEARRALVAMRAHVQESQGCMRVHGDAADHARGGFAGQVRDGFDQDLDDATADVGYWLGTLEGTQPHRDQTTHRPTRRRHRKDAGDPPRWTGAVTRRGAERKRYEAQRRSDRRHHQDAHGPYRVARNWQHQGRADPYYAEACSSVRQMGVTQRSGSERSYHPDVAHWHTYQYRSEGRNRLRGASQR